MKVWQGSKEGGMPEDSEREEISLPGGSTQA